MKKIIFLQPIGKSYGGVCQVNKLLAEALTDKYEVSIISFRNNKGKINLKYSKNIKLKTINEVDEWGTYSGSEIIDNIKDFKLDVSLKKIIRRIKYDFKFMIDSKKMSHHLKYENPDYIIVSHYQLLNMIPKELLGRVINVQHSSFQNVLNHSATMKTLLKFKNKVKFVWLTKNTMEIAKKYGFLNSNYIYNAVRFKSIKRADVINNKRIVAISRLSEEKNIVLMVEIVKKILSDKKFKNWSFDIYGDGDKKIEEKILKLINNSNIKLNGVTNDSKKELLKSSINLNTSTFEGFSLTILEANECGVPTIAFNFGESSNEEIIDKKTGIIAKNVDDYIEKLKMLMLNEDKLNQLSINCKKFSNNFHIEKIKNDWINIFNELDKENKDE